MPAKIAALLPSVVEVWVQATFEVPLFQTVLPAVRFQLPLPAELQVKLAALTGDKDAASKVDAAKSPSKERRELRFRRKETLGQERVFPMGVMAWVVRQDMIAEGQEKFKLGRDASLDFLAKGKLGLVWMQTA